MTKYSVKDPEIRNQIPPGAQLTDTGRYTYVYFGTTVYDKARNKNVSGKKRYSGRIVDGKFQPNKDYAMAVKEQQEAESLRNACETTEKVVREEKLDPRDPQRVVYRMEHALIAVWFSRFAGCTDSHAMALYWKEHRDWFRQRLPGFPDKDISHDTFTRLLGLLDPDKLQKVIDTVIGPLLKGLEGIRRKSADGDHEDRVVPIDGKAIRASRVEGRAPYAVNIWDAKNNICLAAGMVDAKTNEVIPASSLIRHFDLAGAVVTCDALNTQRRVANSVVAARGNYCMTVKVNQKQLHEAIGAAFAKALVREAGRRPGAQRPPSNSLLPDRKIHAGEAELAHGRIERRTCEVLPFRVLLKSLATGWDGLEDGIIARTTTSVIVKQTGEIPTDERFFISSLSFDEDRIAERVGRIVRQHWSIENRLHHVLDVDMLEDWLQSTRPTFIMNSTLLNKLVVGYLCGYQTYLKKETGEDKAPSLRLLMKELNSPSKVLEMLGKVAPELLR